MKGLARVAGGSASAASESTGSSLGVHDRRGFLKGAGLSIAGLVGGGVLLDACTAGSSVKTASSTGSNATGSSGPTSKAIIYAAATAYGTLNPNSPAGSDGLALMGACYDNLVATYVPVSIDAAKAASSSGFPVTPMLAEANEVVNGGLTYRFHLRPNVVSNHGNTLTADDVVWTMHSYLHANAFPGTHLAQVGITQPSQIVKVSDSVVDVKFTTPPPPFVLGMLSFCTMGILDSTEVKRHVTAADPYGVKWLATNVAGFGPYTTDPIESGQQNVILTRRDNYWSDKPPAAKITQEPITESSTRLQLVLSGNANVSVQMSAAQMVQSSGSKTATTTHYTSSVGTFVSMNTSIAPFNNKAVRQAIARAIPYSKIQSNVYRGTAQPWQTVIPPWFPGATDQYWDYDTDLNAAKTGLSSIKGTKVTLTYAAGDGSTESIAVLIREALNSVGLNCTLQGLPLSVIFQQKFKGTLPFYIDDQDSSGITSSLYAFLLFFHRTGSLNSLTRYSNPQVDTMLGQLAAAATTEQQLPLIQNLQKTILSDAPIIPLAYVGGAIVNTKDVGYTKNLSTGILNVQGLRV